MVVKGSVTSHLGSFFFSSPLFPRTVFYDLPTTHVSPVSSPSLPLSFVVSLIRRGKRNEPSSASDSHYCPSFHFSCWLRIALLFLFFFSYSRLLVFVFICSITAALSGLLVGGYTHTSHDLGGVNNQEEGIEENIKGVIWTRKPQPRLIPLPDTYRRLQSP